MSDATNRPGAEEEWENLLRQWRTPPDARPRPYLYRRIRARLRPETAAPRLPVPTWLRWPAYAVMLGMLLLLSGDEAAVRSAGLPQQESTAQSEHLPAVK
ncbi:hypothetical protein KLP40_12620 [Hymenobacter sp. NST-14]|uniref:hypothetical protein n=1 Tax=Hymenobacter piscis TaxID=2839984 RepID=UPI001C026B1D|nr:hypothetical protein [Hymenobacter piscis]MBT9394008.1 hypothetical protein [Hymenobacter piscis]